MSLELYLIRSAESEIINSNETREFEQNNWANLTPKGVNQAKSLGQYFNGNIFSFDKIISSPSIRAQQTARYMLEEMTNMKKKNSLYTTMLFIDRVNSYDANDAFKESYNTASASNYIKNNLTNIVGINNAAIITHKNVMTGLISNMLNIPLVKAYNLNIKNGEIFVLEYENNKWQKKESNEPTFLEGLKEKFSEPVYAKL